MASGPFPGEQQDQFFAQIAVQNGLLESEKLKSALDLQRELADRGENRRLSSLLIQTGDLSAGQVRQVLEELERSMTTCPGCGAPFNIADLPPGKKFLCKRCKTVVTVPGGDPTATPPPHELARTVAASQEELMTPAAPAQRGDDQDAILGRTVGGCKVDRKLGAGGMGAVYLATQVSLGRPVALKILPKSLAANEEYITRFEREARAVALLNHPNIVQVYDMGKDPEGFYFIVMEFVDGTNLSDLWKSKGPLDEKFSLRAIRQSCSGLHAAHEAGILHRDIKPENLMLNKAGRIKITDFGLAKETQGDSQLTGTGIALGTPAYMAPEQGMGETPDRGCDVYSLGGTLFTMVTGRLPYEAKSPLSMMMKHATDPVPLARDAVETISEETEQLIVKSMAKDRGDRFQNMNEMRDAVQRCLEALSRAGSQPAPAATPSSKKAPLSRPGRKASMPPPPERTPLSSPRVRKRDQEHRAERKTPRKGVTSTPRPPQKAVTPERRSREETAKEETARARRKREKAPPREEEERAGKRGGRRGPTPSGRHVTVGKPGGKGPLIALLAGGMGLIVAVTILLVVFLGGKGGQEEGDGSDGGSQTSGTTPLDEPRDTDTVEPGDTGETPPDKPDKPVDVAPLPPGSDEPEGPMVPVNLPHGIRKGERSGEYVNEKDGSVLVYVPAGRVVVGTSDEELAWIRNWFPNLKMKEIRAGQPSHEVYLDGFFIGKFEVTNAQYGRFLEWFRTHSEERERYAHADVPAGNTPQPAFWKKPGYDLPDAPVVGVDWYDAWCYAHWAGLDLPSEAQWEKAAHWDPAKRKRRPFPWGEAVEYGNAYCADRFAGKLFTSNKEFGRWYAMSKGEKNNDLKPVSVRASIIDKSPVGAAGLCGNVAEWCRDNFHHYFYDDDDASERNAYDRAFYPGRAVRGGHFRAPMSKFFARIGWYAEPGVNGRFIGFRCIKPLVAFPEDVSPGLGEVELRALSPLLQKRTVMGLLQRMRRSKNLNGVVFRGRWAVDAFPEESNFYIRLGTALMDTDKVNDALLLFETGAKLPAPDCVVADLHYWQGRAHLIAGNVEAALEAFTRSIEVNPHQFWGNYYRGKTRLEKTRNYDGAILDLEKALEYEDSPTDVAMAHHAMGIVRLKKGDLDGAEREYTVAVYLDTDGYRYRVDRADVYLKQKKWEQARDDYQALLDRKNYSWGFLGMVRLFRAQGDLKKALNAAEQGLKANNTDDSAYRKLEAQRAQIRRALGG